MSVVLARIDDRLIHGQVCTFWVTNRGANRIIIQDTGTANDPLMSKICKQLAPRGTVVEVYTDEEAIPVLKAAFEDGDKAVWLCKFPQQVKMAVEGGVPLKELIVGGMGKRGTRWPLFKNVSADQAERDCFKELNDMGVKCLGQVLPTQKAIDLMSVI